MPPLDIISTCFIRCYKKLEFISCIDSYKRINPRLTLFFSVVLSLNSKMDAGICRSTACLMGKENVVR